MDHTRTSRLVNTIVLALLAVALFLVLKPFMVSILWSLIVALTTWPIYRMICSRLNKGSGNLCALIMTFLIALIIFTALAPMALKVLDEVQFGIRSVSQYLSEPDRAIELPSYIKNIPFIGPALNKWLNDVSLDRGQAVTLLSEYQSHIVNIVKSIAQGVLGWIFKFFIFFFVIFFLYRDGTKYGVIINRIAIKLGGEKMEELIETIRGTVKATVYGLLFTAVAQGFLAGIGYFMIGAPTPILLSFFTIIMSLIPFGTPLVYLPVSVMVVMQGAPWWYGVGMALWGIAVVSTADNFLRSFFISQATNMSVLVVFIGVIGGVLAFGFIGIFLGPVVMAVSITLIHQWLGSYGDNQHLAKRI